MTMGRKPRPPESMKPAGIPVRYKCRCMQDEAVVQVPERHPSEEVVHWVELIMGAAIALDHSQRSPACRSQVMEYAKIPAPENAPYLGGAPKMDS